MARRPTSTVAYNLFFSKTQEFAVKQLTEDLRKRSAQAFAWSYVLDHDWRRLERELSAHTGSRPVLVVAIGQSGDDAEERTISHALRILGARLNPLPRMVLVTFAADRPKIAGVRFGETVDLSGRNYAQGLDRIADILEAPRRRKSRGAQSGFTPVSGIFEAARSQSEMFAELKRQIMEGRIDQKYLYWDVRAALRWESIAELSGYLTAQSSMNLLASKADPILRDAIADEGIKRFTFVNFGVGTGVKDYLILDRLLRDPDAEVLYVPVDDSLSMIQITIRAMQELMREHGERLKVHFVLDDFANAERFAQHIEQQEVQAFGRTEQSSRIVGFLGGSLGNFVETDVLADVSYVLRPERDRLILGVEFIAGRDEKELALNYGDILMKEFLFGPILDVEGLSPNWDNDFLNEVVTGRSAVDDAFTIVGRVMYGRRWVELFQSSKYEEEGLTRFLEELGFTIEGLHTSDEMPSRFGKYVLSR